MSYYRSKFGVKGKVFKNHERKRKLKMLCERYGLSEYMGELFLNELRLSTEPGDEPAKNHARMLGLLPEKK